MTQIFIFFTSFFISLLLTYGIIQFNKKNKIEEKLRTDRWHKHSVGKYGGVAMWFSFLITNVIFLPFEDYKIILILSTMSFCIGLIDDIYDIKPQIKMIYVIALSLGCFYLNIKFIPSLPVYINLPLTIFWFAGIINAVNLIDNLDGLSSGITVIALIVISFYLYYVGNNEMIGISIILIGSCLGFIIFNFPPAKIFMGDSGSFFLGTILSILCLFVTKSPNGDLMTTFLIPIMIMIIPIFDTTFVSVNRYLRNIPLSTGGLDHSSHLLVKLGFSTKKTLLILYFISFCFGGIAIFTISFDFRFWLIFLLFLFIALLSLGIFLSYYKQDMVLINEKVKQKNNNLLQGVYRYKKQIIEILVDSVVIGGSFSIAHFLRFEGEIPEDIIITHDKLILFFISFKIATFYLFGLYRGIWKYASISDMINVFKATVFSTLYLFFILFFYDKSLIYSRSIIILDFLLTFIFVGGFRLFYRLFLEFLNRELERDNQVNRAVIIGIGEQGINVLGLLKNEMEKNEIDLIGFLSSNFNYKGRIVHNLPVIGHSADYKKVLRENNINTVIDCEENNFSSSIKRFCALSNIKYTRPLIKIL